MPKEMNLLLRKEIKRIIEALIFSCHEPVAGKKIKDVVSSFHPITSKELDEILQELTEEYQTRAFSLEEEEGSYYLHTREEYSPYVAELHSGQRGEKLSNAATEVLSIIAYRQPLTRPMIDAIRGLDSSGSVQSLIDRKLIETAGKKSGATLYRTSKDFLQHYGLRSLKDLRNL